jgi:hypothetical protein
LKSANPALNIEILGINVIGEDYLNESAVAGRTLPWLQDVPEQDVWSRWGVEWRDLRIIDSQNRLVAVYNLTFHDLGVLENREEVKRMFLAAAQVVDSDGDQLPDDWEMNYLGALSAKAGEDSDGDGIDNFTEFAFGTNPKDAKSRTSFKPSTVFIGREKFLSLTFRRRAGSILDYAVEASPDLTRWSRSTTDLTQQLPAIHFDGTGTAEVTCTLKAATTSQPYGFLRVKALPRAQP